MSRLKEKIPELLIHGSANAAVQWLVDAGGLPRSAATQLTEYLQTGIIALGAIPTRDSTVIKRFCDEVGDIHIVTHSPFGSRLNRGWELALCKGFTSYLTSNCRQPSTKTVVYFH